MEVEEEFPLEERSKYEEEENDEYFETSFGEEPFFDDPSEELHPLIFDPLSKEPLENQLKGIEKAKRIFLYKLFDKQLSPSYGEKCKNLFSRLELKTSGPNGQDQLLFDGDVAARKSKGQGYEKELSSFQLSRFEATVQEAIQEHDSTSLGKFEMELEKKFNIQDLTPEALRKEYNRRVTKREIAFDGTSGEPIFLLKDGDETRLLKFRQFARRNLFLFAGVAIALASAITAVILVTRRAVRDTGSKFKTRDKEKGETDIIPSEEKEREIIPQTADFVSDNLLTILGVLLLVLFLSKR